MCVFSRVRLLATLWTAARQAPLSLGFSRQECWSGSPCPPPGDLPDPGIEPASPALQADSLLSEPLGKLDGGHILVGILCVSFFKDYIFAGKNTGVGFRFLLQEIFHTQGLNLGLLNCRQILYPLNHQGSP